MSSDRALAVLPLVCLGVSSTCLEVGFPCVLLSSPVSCYGLRDHSNGGVPAVNYFSNTDFSLTWRLTQNLLSLNDMRFKMGLVDMLDFHRELLDTVVSLIFL